MYGSHRFNYYHILLGFVVLWSGCQSGKILIDGRIDNEDTILDRIVIVPDIQYYTNNPERLKYLESISSFIKDSDVPVSTCLQVGDITYQNTEEQWENAYSFFFSRIPDNINLIYCLGNHDYGKNGRSVSRKSNIPKVLEPVKDLECDNTVYENYVRFIKVGGKQYAVLVLEFATRNISLEWANRVIRMNPETNIIILTHAFLNNQGLLFDAFDLDCDNSGSPKE